MIEFYSVRYSAQSSIANELFRLRKTTFKDRLNWDVKCTGNIEFDEYDNSDTVYLLGVKDNNIICSNRFRHMSQPNMIDNTFSTCFDNLSIPIPNQIESSRFFVDKERTRTIEKKRVISTLHYIAMISYSINHQYCGIYTIVSHAMLKIITKSGWSFELINRGRAPDTSESIYLLFMPTTYLSRNTLIESISSNILINCDELENWPLLFRLTTTEV
ncbi:acyl-homoserine-lactone synthase [Pantoea sp. App145]|uniref:acyl-homoserine-lactone synthase n=1 Tax=Pantoea sp. App145 TaxID=3071567 RepID=UPI003A805059